MDYFFLNPDFLNFEKSDLSIRVTTNNPSDLWIGHPRSILIIILPHWSHEKKMKKILIIILPCWSHEKKMKKILIIILPRLILLPIVDLRFNYIKFLL